MPDKPRKLAIGKTALNINPCKNSIDLCLITGCLTPFTYMNHENLVYIMHSNPLQNQTIYYNAKAINSYALTSLAICSQLAINHLLIN